MPWRQDHSNIKNDNLKAKNNMPSAIRNNKPHYEGHRQRAYERLSNLGHENLFDYEIVELMLFIIFKRKDVKSLAKNLIHQFGSINKILNAPEKDLLKVPGIGLSSVRAIRIINSIVKASLRSRIVKRDILNCSEDVVNYCRINMQNLVSEELHIIFLDTINQIITTEVIQKGDIDKIDIYPRVIAKRCLELGAKSIILIHNHPSGNPTPSASDLYTTKIIISALEVFDITVLDHVIVSANKHVSLKALNLI